MRNLKCVVVGDGDVGKTSLLVSYTQDIFPTNYLPTTYDNYSVTLVTEGTLVNLGINDTSRTTDRTTAYNGVDVFLLCYSVTDPESYANVRNKWYPELHSHSPKTPIVLVGTKTDTRTDSVIVKALKRRSWKAVSRNKGVKLMKDISAVRYLECSAMSRKGLKKVFDTVARTALNPNTVHKQDKHFCSFM